MIEVRDLTKSFRVARKEPGLKGSVRALFRRQFVLKEAVRGVSFDVQPGELVGLVGPNGAGKTTIVKMLCGIVHPSSGVARVFGYDPWQRSNEYRRRLALVMGQKAQLWWDLPAGDSFLLLKEIYGLDGPTYKKSLAHLTGVLDVERHLGVPVRRLSLGERMRLELVAALLHRPQILFLDEPTIGLDLTAQRAIRDFLATYQREAQPATILTSHYMEDIERLCKRILVLQQGRIAFDGPLEELRRRYAQAKVLVVHLRVGESAAAATDSLSDVGEVLGRSGEEVRVRVDRDRVASAAQALLARLPVADLAIQDEDMGTIVERIWRGGPPAGS